MSNQPLLPSAGDRPPTFSFVTAAHNVAPYLRDFLSSVVGQPGFGTDIELIVVDDGSRDATPAILRQWASRHAGITLLRQENVGVAVARNLGLGSARGRWVSFADADDFLARNYFDALRRAISDHAATSLLPRPDDDLVMLSARVVRYREEKWLRRVRRNHPLDARYRKPVARVAVEDMGPFLQMAVNHAFFRRDLVESHAVRFDTRVQPNFEDSKFAGQYLLRVAGGSCLFVRAAEYFHRRRRARTSLLDSSPTDPRLLDDVIRHGMIELLDEAERLHGRAPAWVQRMCLYSVSWTLRGLRRGTYPIAADPEARARFEVLARRLFARLDAKTISAFELGKMDAEDRRTVLDACRDATPA